MWWRPLNAIRVTHHSHNQIVFQMIAAASYSNSHNNCKVAKLNALYMRHVGVPVRAFDILHEFGFVMSYAWTCDAIENIVQAELQSMKHAASRGADNGGVALVYDNFNLEAKSFEQRLLNRKVVKNGTALCVRVLPHAARILQNRGSLKE